MAAQIEIAKRRYSSELAAYTFEQWRAARREYRRTQANTADRKDGRGASDPRDHDDEDSDSDDEPAVRQHPTVKAADYATSAPVAVNGGARH